MLVHEMEPCYGGQVRLVTGEGPPVDDPALHAPPPALGSQSDPASSSQSCPESDNTPDTSLASIMWEGGDCASESKGNGNSGQPISRSFPGPVGYCANRLNPAQSGSALSSASSHPDGYASFGSVPHLHALSTTCR